MPPSFLAHWRLKLLLSLVFNVFFWLGYEILGRHPFFPIREIPSTALDRLIPFQPHPWGWIYLSQFLFTSLLPWFLPTRDDVIRCFTGLVVMTSLSFAVFLFFPAPPPPRPSATALSLSVIAFYDGTYTCFPSLHAAFLCYMAALGRRIFAHVTPLRYWSICVLWGSAILYATIATRQHYALDLAAGLAVGGFAYAFAWRGRDNAAARMRVDRAVTSHSGIK